jgi:serine protease AprX
MVSLINMRATIFRVVVGLVLLTVPVTAGTSRPSHADKRESNATKRSSKLDLDLQRVRRTHRDGRVRVIVTPVPGHHDAAVNKHRTHGDAILSEHTIVDAFSAEVDADDLDRLEADPDVANVSVDAVVTSDAAADSVSEAIPSALLGTLGLDGTQDTGPSGKGVGIAVIDSGLERGTDLDGGEHDQQYDFAGGFRHVAPYDDYGHGTHVSGLIGGSGKSSEGDCDEIGRDGKFHRFKVRVYQGVAPDARIISLKVLNSAGGGLTSDVINAIEFAVANRRRLKINVINLSLGHPIYEPQATDPLVQAVEAAVRSGIVVVASAGNFGRNPNTGVQGYAGITSPGNAPSAITVGAVDTGGSVSRLDDRIASYSSRGPTWYDATAKPDVVAPGHRLVAAAALRSSLYSEQPSRRVGWGNKKQQQYLMLSGTSMAAAVTSGVVALMIEAHREHFKEPLTPNAIKALLEFSAIPLPGVDYLTQGAGSVNAAGAIALAASADTVSPSGSWWLTTGVQPQTTIDGTTLSWGQVVVWGNVVVWGSTAYYNLDAWALNTVWGDVVVWGNVVVWGSQTDVVWDNPQSWANVVVWGSGLLDVGASADGSVDWNTVDPTTVVWGNLMR